MKLIALLISMAMADVDLKSTGSLFEKYPETTLLNEIVVFKPVENHKVNLQSPNSCGEQGRVIETKETGVKCQFTKGGEHQLELYACDAKKSYCRREQLKISTETPKGILGYVGSLFNGIFSTSSWKGPQRTDRSLNKTVRGFIANDWDKALSQARSENKRILIYATQMFCPPCRLLKEVSFASDEFQELTKDYVKLQIDLDVESDPERMKSLDINRTPTLLVYNSSFEELGRSVRLLSPQQVKKWLDETPDEPIQTLAAKPRESLTEAEKWRFAQWAAVKTEMDPKSAENLAYQVSQLLSAKDERTQLYKDLFAVRHTNDEAAKARLKKFQPKSLESGDIVAESYFYSINSAYPEKLTSALAAPLIKIYENHLQRLKTQTLDPVQSGLDQMAVVSVLQYIANKSGDKSAVERARQFTREMAEAFPRLPGVTDTTQLAVIRAEASEKPEETEKIYSQFSEKNKGDSAYDYWQASSAFYEDKDYEKAQKWIDQTLLKARDRNWQKAVLLKLEILQALKKGDEAQTLIDKTLKDIELPYSEHPAIHRFVQQLRSQQRKLVVDTKTTTTANI